MRERPIIFNADMVRAVLDGRKTQTRRIMREQPEVIPKEDEFGKPGFWIQFNAGKTMVRNEDMYIACPFGLKGDRLWVRETWMPDAPRDGTWGDVEFYGCKGSPLSMIPERYRTLEHCIHRAGWDGHEMVGWTPSIHMPRWASRITLEITGVRVERLNSISEADALAEGVRRRESTPVTDPAYCNYLATNLNDGLTALATVLSACGSQFMALRVGNIVRGCGSLSLSAWRWSDAGIYGRR